MHSTYQILTKLQRFTGFAFCAAVLCLSSARAGVADEITVFAASSLRDALGTVAGEYRGETGVEVVLVFAASSAIARQVAQGAPADAVLLADEDWAEWLLDEGAIDRAIPFASNRMVLVGAGVPQVSAQDLADLLRDELIAMGQVDAVPAGRYGKAALAALGLWEQVQPRVIQAANVRAALRYVERGEVAFGIGYASDLVALPELSEVYGFAPDTHPPIVYSGGHLTQQGAVFMNYLQSVTAQDILGDWGFSPMAEVP